MTPITLAVLGDGAWGTAIALLLAKNSRHRVRLWSARPATGLLLRESRENMRLLPGALIPESVHLCTDPAEAIAGADFGISAIPTVYLRTTLMRFQGCDALPFVSLTKGIENETFSRPSEIISDATGSKRVAVLSGPSHAEEVCRGQPTSVVVAASDAQLAAQVQEIFFSERFRVYTSNDPIGVELAGALKNVIGIAAGICDGLRLGDNSKSALLTRGIVEMTRFGVQFGLRPALFKGWQALAT